MSCDMAAAALGRGARYEVDSRHAGIVLSRSEVGIEEVFLSFRVAWSQVLLLEKLYRASWRASG